MPIDYKRIDDFIARAPTRALIAKAVRGAGFEVVWVAEDAPALWSFYLKPNKPLREILGTSREILLWVSEYPEYQARAVMQAAARIDRERPRLCEDFALVITGDPGTRRYVEETGERENTHYLGFALDEFRGFKPHGKAEFIAGLQERFFTKDLYWLSTAVTTPSAFFGRRHLISEISSLLRNGSSHVGLFGLRKMGKTSFLYRIMDSILADSSSLVAHIDLQRIDAIGPSTEYFLWSLGEQLLDSNLRLRRLGGLRLFGQFPTFGEAPRAAVLELFDHDIAHILREAKWTIVVLLDEIELMSPEAPNSRWGDCFVQVWRLLRGIAQQSPGRFSFFITGTNPRCLEAARFDGTDNPLYNYFTTYYLPALTRAESQELLGRLGQRMGLLWPAEAIDKVARFVGGHPFLLRAFASRVHRSLLPRRESQTVTGQRVAYVLEPFQVEMGSTFAQITEVLADQYPDEYFLLETLSLGRLGEFRELALEFPDDTAHLVGYGLVHPELQSAGLEMEVLQSWIQRRHVQKSSSVPRDASDELSPGSKVEDYEISASIGHRGGFSRVYKARDGRDDGAVVALKVFLGGSFASLQREVDVLETITHPNIVQVLDYGRASSGELFLAMEYLQGETLRRRCDRARRLDTYEIQKVLTVLLKALAYLHPDEEKLTNLRTKPELSLDEFRILSAARHGYVHRDIKPENVVLVQNRGPVLIDFNIASRVATPVRTLSSTVGYLPPDGLGGTWTSDVDLFQLGVTMLQASVGVEYTSENLQELRSMARTELEPRLAETLLWLSATRREERPPSALAVLRSLGEAGGKSA